MKSLTRFDFELGRVDTLAAIIAEPNPEVTVNVALPKNSFGILATAKRWFQVMIEAISTVLTVVSNAGL